MPELLLYFLFGAAMIGGLLMGGVLTMIYFCRRERRAREAFEMAEARHDYVDPKGEG